MKKNTITIILVLLSSIVFGQIKVNSSGQVMINSASDPVEAMQIGTTWSFHNGGTKHIAYNAKYSSGANRRIISDESCRVAFDSNGELRIGVAEYSTAGSSIDFEEVTFKYNSDKVDFFPKYNRGGNLGTSSNMWNELFAWNAFFYTHSNSLSDLRVKTNIRKIDNALNNIIKLDGVLYDFSNEAFKKLKVDKNKFSLDSCKNNYGFIAQEVKKIFPYIVNYDNNIDLYSYKPAALIPVLTEAIKELNEKVETNSGLINELQNKIKKLEDNSISNLKSTSVARIDAKLYQNAPNPFSLQTKIKFQLPVDFIEASIIIYNMQGTQIMRKILNKNDSEVITNASELQPGMYMYSLIVDNIEIDTKKMILTD